MADLTHLRHRPEPPGVASCGLRAALDVAGGKWKPLILWHLLQGPMRSGVLRRAVGGVSEKVFAEQLDQLEAAKVVERTVLADQPLAVQYGLTPTGERLAPALAALSAWGYENLVDPGPAGPNATG